MKEVAMVQESLAGLTLLMSGGSRGIGFEIALEAAKKGANTVLLAKTDKPHPKLPGTIHTAVAEIEAAGGRAVAVVGDVRKPEDAARAVEVAIKEFGGLDIVVNNASAINLAGSLDLAPKHFELIHDVNIKGTWNLTTAALPHILESGHGRILTLSPPLNLKPYWLGLHPGYTLSKYGMTMLTLGWAEEFKDRGIRAFCLWPETLIDTAAVRNVVGGEDGARTPTIMADAAIDILQLGQEEANGKVFIDSEVLTARGVELGQYGGGENPTLDIFID